MTHTHRIVRFLAWMGGALVLTALIVVAMVLNALAEAPAQPLAVASDPEVLQWALLSAALAVGVSALAAAYAVGRVGSAAVGALAEKPELMGRLLILVGLAEGIAIYGLIIAILILNRAA
ncbi:MAG TPA: ATP synthase subunit C [Steroidobacteraceae bacterium]|nr:ATP synthase subunit C [Steroidobacteraceae bacterium]